MLKAEWNSSPVLGRAAIVMSVLALALQLWSLLGSIPAVIFVGMHLGTMALMGALFLRVVYHHRLHWMRGAPPPTWDPFAPRARVSRRALVLAAAGVNLIMMMALASYADAGASSYARVELRLFSSAWLFFALTVALGAPVVERRIRARVAERKAATSPAAT